MTELNLRERKLALRPPAAADAADVGKTTIYDAMKCGELAYLQVGGVRLIKVDDLDAWLEKHRVVETA